MNNATLIEKIAWLAVDWGTTHLRVFAMDAQGRELAALHSAQGMAKLQSHDYEAVLRALIAPWHSQQSRIRNKRLTVMCCGMVGAKQGWVEAPYRELADTKTDTAMDVVPVPLNSTDLQVFIVPGVRQAQPADVMRGEETQIAGFLSANRAFDGIICLPGSHTKWVRIKMGAMIAFRTIMTGELFAALATHTVLKHTIASEGFDHTAFATAFDEVLRQPACLSALLFSLRARHLSGEINQIMARSMLSGILLGAEIAAVKSLIRGQKVVIIGAEQLCDIYQLALQKTGIQPVLFEAAAMTKAGLYAAYQRLECV